MNCIEGIGGHIPGIAKWGWVYTGMYCFMRIRETYERYTGMVCIPANIPGIYCGGWAIAWWRPQGHAPPPDMCGFKIDSARLAFFDMCGVPPLHGCTLEKHIGEACTATFNVWVHPTPRGWGVGQGVYLGPQTGHWYIPVYTGMYTIPAYLSAM